MNTLYIAESNSPDKRPVVYDETVNEWDVYIVKSRGNGFSKMAVNKNTGEVRYGGIALEYDLGKEAEIDDTANESTANTNFSTFKPLT